MQRVMSVEDGSVVAWFFGPSHCHRGAGSVRAPIGARFERSTRDTVRIASRNCRAVHADAERFFERGKSTLDEQVACGPRVGLTGDELAWTRPWRFWAKSRA